MRMLARTFPLLERPPVPLPSKPHASDTPTLWIAKSKDEGILSADTECLKWQAYLALSQKAPIAIRTDISPSGALENKLPNLFLPTTSTLLPAHHIPSFVEDTRPFDGYASKAEQTESLAWISLLEGTVHAALLLSQKANESYLRKLLGLGTGGKETPVEALLTPSPAPLTGFASLLPANMGTKINIEAVIAQYREAIASLSDRLDTDKWFLGSE